MPVITEPTERTLIDELLAEQRDLSAVSRFFHWHETHAQNGAPALASHYRSLLPATPPARGEQYAFEVDLDKCSGCKACVTACHSLNGLDDNETWRDVGLLLSDDWRRPFQQTITTACHHCADPGCANGCPVLAYDKDPLTGIVRHLDDQCIGCQYCVMKCPYEVPKYSAARGIVRKCDMCHSRLAVGEAPACVQACPTKAIRITLIETEVVESQFRNSGTTTFLPSAPNPAITLPTTRYVSKRPLPATLLAGDQARVAPADSHLPLVFMLVLTQLSVGASIAATFVEPAKWLVLVSATVGALALGIASLHLGKPLNAWRAFLGWRKSWFSREVIVFGAFVPLAAVHAGAFWFKPMAAFQPTLAVATALAGLLGVICSAMIYVDTRREFWSAAQTFGKFLGTMLLLGAAITFVSCFLTSAARPPALTALAVFLFVVTIAKLAFEHRIFRHLVDEETPALTPLNKSARLIEGQLGLVARTRVACAVLGGLLLPLLLLLNGGGFALAVLVLCVMGELLERYLFFTAVAPVTMPGGVVA
jgi:formate dehydrogenase iron-sulfur subunit